MIKAVLLDADGVVIAPHPRFSDRLEKEFGVPREKIAAFFGGPFQECKVGRANLKEELAKILPEWGLNTMPDELMRIWFAGENALNEDVLSVIDELHTKNIKCYLASDNEKYRAEYIMRKTGLNGKLDGAFFSCNLGATKSDPEFYRKVLEELEISPGELMFWDDDQKNVDAGKTADIDARFYESADALLEVVRFLTG